MWVWQKRNKKKWYERERRKHPHKIKCRVACEKNMSKKLLISYKKKMKLSLATSDERCFTNYISKIYKPGRNLKKGVSASTNKRPEIKLKWAAS